MVMAMASGGATLPVVRRVADVERGSTSDRGYVLDVFR